MKLVLYGAYGYSGELAAELAVERDVDDLVLAGRNPEKTTAVAEGLGADYRVFSVDDAANHLDDSDVLLNCAGPFVETYEPMVEACIETETHYLDITGEIDVFEGVAEYDEQADDAGVCLLPGVGFDVVPTDCLAAHLKERLPGATDLTLGFEPDGSISRGTLLSGLDQASDGGKVRRDGDLKRVAPAHKHRRIDFGRGRQNAVTIPWGDVSTADHSTGIENIEVYLGVGRPAANAMRAGSLAAPLLSLPPVKMTAERIIETLVDGPDERTREEGACYVWGEATDGEQTVTSRLETPEGYSLTADAAITSAQRIREQESPPTGYQTPATAFSAEYVLELEGVEGFVDE